MRSSSWNQNPEIQQQFQVNHSRYYVPPSYLNEREQYQQQYSSEDKYGFHHKSNFEPLVEYPYSDDIAFAPIDVGSNSGISAKSDANSVAISNSDEASICLTSTATREKSKNAARMRRSNENCEYKELSHYLPLPSDEKIMLDKASTIRLTTNFLKMRALFFANQKNTRNAMPRQTCLSAALEDALDGFLLILCGEGSILYVCETIKHFLGLSKWEITGTKFLDIVKNEDQEQLLENLRLTPWEENEIECVNKDYIFIRRFVIRVKCLLSKSKNSLASEGYKAVHFFGHLKARILQNNGSSLKQVQNLIGIAHTLPVVNRISTEVKLNRDMFMFRAGLDLKLSYVDDQIENLTGYLPKSIMEKSLYDLIHCGDIEEVADCHRIHKGQVTFKFFRLLCQNGGWIWVQAYAIILRGSRVSKPDCIVGFANVLTSIQVDSMTFDVCQLNTGAEGRCDEEIFTTNYRRKRRYPMSESGKDERSRNYSVSDMIFMDKFNTGSGYENFTSCNSNPCETNPHVTNCCDVQEPIARKQHTDKESPYMKEQSSVVSAVNLPSSLVVHSFMEQLSINASASTYPENWLYSFNNYQQY